MRQQFVGEEGWRARWAVEVLLAQDRQKFT
jgi:hypothetical protein